MLNIALRIFTLVLFLSWILYWQVEQWKTYKAKPLNKEKPKLLNVLSRIGIRALFIFVILLLLGLKLLPIATIDPFQYIGMGLVLFGILITVSARIALSTNWSNAYEYQIKKGQELVGHGIYAYIRHPIYSGMTIMFIGAAMIAGSWLWVSFLGLFGGR